MQRDLVLRATRRLGAIIVAFAPDHVEGTVELHINLAPVIDRDLDLVTTLLVTGLLALRRSWRPTEEQPVTKRAAM